VVVVTGRAVPSGASVPYRPLAEALLQALRALPVRDEAGLRRWRPRAGARRARRWRRGRGAITQRATGETVPATFRELFVLHRDGGDWKIARYMFQPMPTT
jgi:hypothetical protein